MFQWILFHSDRAIRKKPHMPDASHIKTGWQCNASPFPLAPGAVRALALTSAFLWGAVELLSGWLDLDSLDPSSLQQAGLDDECSQLLSALHPKAIHLLRSYLHRLLMAGALPETSRSLSRLLEFLGRNAEHQFSGLGPPAGQILGWLSSAPRETFKRFPVWRTYAISGSVVARFEDWVPDAQRMLFLDLQLRCWLGTLYPVPVLERGWFFGEVLKFFTSDPPAQLYPVYLLPQLHLFGSTPGSGLEQPIYALHSPLISPSQKIFGAESGCGSPVRRSHGKKLPPFSATALWQNALSFC